MHSIVVYMHLAFVLLFCSQQAFGDLSSGGLFGLASALERRNNTDVLFVADVSTGLDQSTFTKVKALAVKAFTCFGFPQTNRMALITFSNTTATLLSFKSCTQRSCYAEKFKSIRYSRKIKGRAIGEALRVARRTVKGSKQKSAKIVTLLVSGPSNVGRRPEAVARRLKNMGVEIFVVGLGADAMRHRNQLRRLASSSQHYVQFTNPNQQVAIADIMVDIVCKPKDTSNTACLFGSLFCDGQTSS